jgi:calcineurin-like phosphoesterase family protein
MTIWFTGCTHYGHKGILGMGRNPPFSTIEEHDETLLDNHNALVKPKDTVYHLGDFSMKNGAINESVLKRLKGNIIPIRGNHDPKDWGVPYHEFRLNKQLFVLMHYPIEEWNGWYRGSIHLHAHTHTTTFKTAERRFSVGVDACNFRPVSLEEILAAA